MTLIAIAAHEDRAEILTDTLAYTVTASKLGRASKVHVVPHLDAAVLVHGSADLGRFWAVHALGRSSVDSFDQLVDQAPDALRQMWAELSDTTQLGNDVAGTSYRLPRSAALAVGYSERAGRFRAFAWESDRDFTPVPLDEPLFVIPSPLGVRPSDLELRRLDADLPALYDDHAAVDGFLAGMRRAPSLDAPTGPTEWTALATTVRQQRAVEPPLSSGLKMYVGGDALLTRIRRGASSTERLLTFDDTADELTQMMAGSLHPLGQLAACEDCDSGRRFVDCCLQQIADDPCPCGSGDVFARCCSLLAGSPAAAAATA